MSGSIKTRLDIDCHFHNLRVQTETPNNHAGLNPHTMEDGRSAALRARRKPDHHTGFDSFFLLLFKWILWR